MARVHRAIAKRAKRISASEVADRAEEYIEGFRMYRSYLKNVKGLASIKRLRTLIKKIDAFEREVERMEDKIDNLLYRRKIEAAKLEELLDENLDTVKDYVSKEEFRDFFG